ncbi:hypothetical protein BV22DRAFT_1051053 [Leucogyrophana mollusca]|uniref:Uncharacterized protein n=1 Tax=Leucogyrophana mollusca TaxID=85980 RepID=A0ACB8B1M3_9AGAM|nr:hypothetical protein BV22DRAFT_1051053 [Leucogyrophana mollusca]
MVVVSARGHGNSAVGVGVTLHGRKYLASWWISSVILPHPTTRVNIQPFSPQSSLTIGLDWIAQRSPLGLHHACLISFSNGDKPTRLSVACTMHVQSLLTNWYPTPHFSSGFIREVGDARATGDNSLVILHYVLSSRSHFRSQMAINQLGRRSYKPVPTRHSLEHERCASGSNPAVPSSQYQTRPDPAEPLLRATFLRFDFDTDIEDDRCLGPVTFEFGVLAATGHVAFACDCESCLSVPVPEPRLVLSCPVLPKPTRFGPAYKECQLQLECQLECQLLAWHQFSYQSPSPPYARRTVLSLVVESASLGSTHPAGKRMQELGNGILGQNVRFFILRDVASIISSSLCWVVWIQGVKVSEIAIFINLESNLSKGTAPGQVPLHRGIYHAVVATQFEGRLVFAVSPVLYPEYTLELGVVFLQIIPFGIIPVGTEVPKFGSWDKYYHINELMGRIVKKDLESYGHNMQNTIMVYLVGLNMYGLMKGELRNKGRVPYLLEGRFMGKDDVRNVKGWSSHTGGLNIGFGGLHLKSKLAVVVTRIKQNAVSIWHVDGLLYIEATVSGTTRYLDIMIVSPERLSLEELLEFQVDVGLPILHPHNCAFVLQRIVKKAFDVHLVKPGESIVESSGLVPHYFIISGLASAIWFICATVHVRLGNVTCIVIPIRAVVESGKLQLRVTVHGIELTNEEQWSIVDVLNRPYDHSTHFGWCQWLALPKMLTPNSSSYDVEPCCLNNDENAGGIVMWEQLSPLSPFHRQATHAAHFWLDVAPHCSSLGLASFLTTFLRLYTDRSSPSVEYIANKPVVGLGFLLSYHGVGGTILCHRNTINPGKDLSQCGGSAVECYRVADRRFAVLSIPDTRNDLVRSGVIAITSLRYYPVNAAGLCIPWLGIARYYQPRFDV